MITPPQRDYDEVAAAICFFCFAFLFVVVVLKSC